MQTQKRTRKQSGFAALLVGAVSLGLGFNTTASAASIQVNTLLDGSVAGACTLRDAIAAANMDTAVNGCHAGLGADTITFTVGGTITLGTSLPQVISGSTITVDGSGPSITVSGSNRVKVFLNAGTLQLKNLTVANGYWPGAGGGIDNAGTLSISNCTFSRNIAGSGAAIANNVSGTFAINSSTFSDNSGAGGGAIENVGVGTISNSTFSNNSVRDAGGAIVNHGTLTLINNTFSGNSAGGLGGGAIYNVGTLSLANTIIANSSSGGDCVNNGTINTSGVNLVMDGSCSIGGLTGDPLLDHLADNGGPTKTFALLIGSPAINAADTTICANPPVGGVDQRGQPRLTDGMCDIGAYESAPSFLFTGFLAPVANPPAENSVKAGQGVPIKFSLGGNQGLNIFASGSPFSQPASCSTVTTDVTQTVTAGNSSLSYDPASNTYTYVWKTDPSWAGSCRQFLMRLTDGSYHVANFLFR